MPRKPPRMRSTAHPPKRTRNSDPEGWSLRKERPAGPWPVFSFAQLLAAMIEHAGIDDVSRFARGERDDLVENIRKLNLVLIARDIADMRRRHDIVHVQQRIGGITQRFLLEHVDCGIAGVPDA